MYMAFVIKATMLISNSISSYLIFYHNIITYHYPSVLRSQHSFSPGNQEFLFLVQLKNPQRMIEQQYIIMIGISLFYTSTTYNSQQICVNNLVSK